MYMKVQRNLEELPLVLKKESTRENKYKQKQYILYDKKLNLFCTQLKKINYRLLLPLYTEEGRTARNIRSWRFKVFNGTESAVLAFLTHK